jgi:hypothetical protein
MVIKDKNKINSIVETLVLNANIYISNIKNKPYNIRLNNKNESRL